MSELFLFTDGDVTCGPYSRDEIREKIAEKQEGWDFAAQVFSLATRKWRTVGEMIDEPEPEPCVNEDCYIWNHRLGDLAELREAWRNGLDLETLVVRMGEHVVTGGGMRETTVRGLIAETSRLDCSMDVSLLRFFYRLGMLAVLVRLVWRLVVALRSAELDFWAIDRDSLFTLGLLLVALGLLVVMRLLTMFDEVASGLARYTAAPPPPRDDDEGEPIPDTDWMKVLNAAAATKRKSRKR